MFGGDQVAQFQHVVLLQPGAGLAVVFDQDATGARVADVQHQVHRNRFDQAIAVVGDHFQLGDFNFRPGRRLLGRRRLAQQAEQVEVVRQVIVGADIDVQLCARTVGIALIEHFQQPLVDPRLRQKPAGFASLGRQFERHAGACLLYTSDAADE